MQQLLDLGQWAAFFKVQTFVCSKFSVMFLPLFLLPPPPRAPPFFKDSLILSSLLFMVFPIFRCSRGCDAFCGKYSFLLFFFLSHIDFSLMRHIYLPAGTAVQNAAGRRISKGNHTSSSTEYSYRENGKQS